MKKIFAVLAGYLVLVLSGCSGGSCGDMCGKSFECDPYTSQQQMGSVGQCTAMCESESSDILDCMLDCDTDEPCLAYGICILECAGMPL